MLMRLVFAVSLVSLVIGGACASARSGAPVPQLDAPATGGGPRVAAQAPAPAATAAPAAAREARPAAAPQGSPADAAAQPNLPPTDRMIIRTVSMTIGVSNVQDAYREVERIATEQGGLIAGSQVRQDGDRTTATVTIRVPADPTTYRTTLERLRGIADKVVEEQAEAQDITEAYVDLESRLRNLRASEDSLLALLAKAQRVEDLLQIQRELTNVRGQIEQIQGRKQAMERRADMATITLQIREAGAIARGGWNPGDTFGEAIAALLQAARALLTFVIWLIVWIPLWGGALLLLWAVSRYARGVRSFGRRSAPSSPGGPA